MATIITDTNTAIQYVEQEAHDYLARPFDLDEVALTVSKAPKKRRAKPKNGGYRQHPEQKVQEPADRIHVSFLDAITALAYALEAKDAYASGHSQRVAETSAAIAREMAMPQNSIDKMRLAGLIHDIGKIALKESILNKPGRLTEQECEHIKSHPKVGERILTPITEDKEILQIVRHHHERYDGRGYPDGLEADQIPLGARILAVSDAYDAMTSNHSYRAVMTAQLACLEIELGKGTRFDPGIADIFLKIID